MFYTANLNSDEFNTEWCRPGSGLGRHFSADTNFGFFRGLQQTSQSVAYLQQVEITADNASNGELEPELLSGLAVKKVQLLGVGSEMR